MSNDIKERIKKLLNLANNAGATEAEAARAMEMASALMMKYNITIDPDTEEAKVTSGPLTGQYFTDMWHITLASAATYLYMCKIIRYPNTGVKFIGRPDNIDACEQTWYYLIEQVEALYKLNLPRGMSKSDRAEFRRTFKFACATRVYSRAQQIMQQFRSNDAKALEYTGSKALVVVQTIDAQLKECETFMAKQFPDLTPMRSGNRKTGSGTLAGFRAAEKVNLNRKVS